MGCAGLSHRVRIGLLMEGRIYFSSTCMYIQYVRSPYYDGALDSDLHWGLDGIFGPGSVPSPLDNHTHNGVYPFYTSCSHYMTSFLFFSFFFFRLSFFVADSYTEVSFFPLSLFAVLSDRLFGCPWQSTDRNSLVMMR